MPREGYDSVSIPNDDLETAQDYKPDTATWGDCLVAGAERLNENLDSDVVSGHDSRFYTGDPSNTVDVDAIIDELKTAIDTTAYDGGLSDEHAEELLSSLEAIETRTGRIERQLDTLTNQ